MLTGTVFSPYLTATEVRLTSISRSSARASPTTQSPRSVAYLTCLSVDHESRVPAHRCLSERATCCHYSCVDNYIISFLAHLYLFSIYDKLDSLFAFFFFF